ncbi:TPA: helix-turn-helix transcriptional regulator [Streptococcus suis]|nr:helix-turn-helix transcriptional regulator [Streptococcus suis]
MNTSKIRGERLRELRIKNGYGQLELAKKLGYKSDATISKWESGTTFPNGKKLALVAQVLGTTSDYLLALEDDYKEARPTIDLADLRENIVFFEGEELSDEELEKIAQIIQLTLR